MKFQTAIALGVSVALLAACGTDEVSDAPRTKNSALATSSTTSPVIVATTGVTIPSTVPVATVSAPTTVVAAPTTTVPLVAPTTLPVQTTAAPASSQPAASTTMPVVSIAQAPGATTRQFNVTPNTVNPARVPSRVCNIVQKKVVKSTKLKPNVFEDSFILLRTTLGCPTQISSVQTWHEGPSGRLDEIKSLSDAFGNGTGSAKPSVDVKRVNDFNERDELYRRGSKVANEIGSFFNILYDYSFLGKEVQDSCLIGDLEAIRYGFLPKCAPSKTRPTNSVFAYEVPNPGFNYLSEVSLRSCQNWTIPTQADKDTCRKATLVVRIVFSDGYAIENIRIPLQ